MRQAEEVGDYSGGADTCRRSALGAATGSHRVRLETGKRADQQRQAICAVRTSESPLPLYRQHRIRDAGSGVFAPCITAWRYGGANLTISIEDLLARAWHDHDCQEPPEPSLRKGITKPRIAVEL